MQLLNSWRSQCCVWMEGPAQVSWLWRGHSYSFDDNATKSQHKFSEKTERQLFYLIQRESSNSAAGALKTLILMSDENPQPPNFKQKNPDICCHWKKSYLSWKVIFYTTIIFQTPSCLNANVYCTCHVVTTSATPDSFHNATNCHLTSFYCCHLFHNVRGPLADWGHAAPADALSLYTKDEQKVEPI